MSRMEDRIGAGEALFPAVFEHSPIDMAVVGMSGRWLRANRALCELFGCTEWIPVRRSSRAEA